jgi:hypothetical protein
MRRARDGASILDDDLSAFAVKIARQALPAPSHRAGRVEVRDSEHEGLASDMRQLVITPLELVPDGLGKS